MAKDQAQKVKKIPLAPYPAYETQLETFVEITPQKADEEYSWLCRAKLGQEEVKE